jgi:predicted secreted hydrolase
MQVVGLEEKPQRPRSKYAIPGLYFYDGTIVDRAKQLKPSNRGELEITDLNKSYLNDRELRAIILERGTAWLDHEWSDSLLPPGAVGWDWIGMNLADGSALTAFRLRAADGRTVYAGGSLRSASGSFRNFAADEVIFTPHRVWTSPSSQAKYPVEWTLQTPAGRHRIVALLDAQELDSRQSTGTIYWEGLSELRDEQGQRIGRGYLEMTGYAGALRL